MLLGSLFDHYGLKIGFSYERVEKAHKTSTLCENAGKCDDKVGRKDKRVRKLNLPVLLKVAVCCRTKMFYFLFLSVNKL